MKKALILTAIAWFVWRGAGVGQHLAPEWEAQPEELKAIWLEARDLCGKCDYGLKRVREPQFVKRVVECGKRIDKYTREHAGNDLNWFYWGRAFVDAYRLAGTQVAQGYPAQEKTLREGLELLSKAKSDDPFAVPHVALEMRVWHVHNCVESNPAECAAVWDDAGSWVRETGMPELERLWQYHRATVEPRLLACAAGKLKGEQYAAFSLARLRVIAGYATDESVPMRHRSTALRCVVEYLNARDESRIVSGLVERLMRDKDATPDYYYSRMAVALFGEGDWAKATDTLDRMNAASAQALLKPSEARMREKTYDLYYGNMFLPGLELMRRSGVEAAGQSD